MGACYAPRDRDLGPLGVFLSLPRDLDRHSDLHSYVHRDLRSLPYRIAILIVRPSIVIVNLIFTSILIVHWIFRLATAVD